MCMPGGRRLAYNISFQETVHFERGPLHFYHFLSHAFANVLRRLWSNLSPSPLFCPCCTNEVFLTSLSLTSQPISLTSISLHHYRRIDWLERIQGGKWKTIFSKSRSQPLSTCPSDLWDICVMGFFINTTGKFLTHLNARRFEKNALIQNVISNFHTQLATLMVGFFRGKRSKKNWYSRSR